MAAKNVGSVNIDISANTAEFKKSVETTIGKLNDLSSTLGKFTGLSNVGESLKGFAKGLVLIAATEFTVGAVAKALEKLIDTAKRAENFKLSMGVDPTQFMQFEKAFSKVGGEAERAREFIEEFQDKIIDAKDKNNDSRKTIEALGLSYRELADKPTIEAMMIVIKRLQELGTSADVANAGTKLLGSQYKEYGAAIMKMNPVLSEQTVMSEEQRKKTVELDRDWGLFKKNLQGFATNTGMAAIEVITQITTVLGVQSVEMTKSESHWSTFVKNLFRITTAGLYSILEAVRLGVHAIITGFGAIGTIWESYDETRGLPFVERIQKMHEIQRKGLDDAKKVFDEAKTAFWDDGKAFPGEKTHGEIHKVLFSGKYYDAAKEEERKKAEEAEKKRLASLTEEQIKAEKERQAKLALARKNLHDQYTKEDPEDEESDTSVADKFKKMLEQLKKKTLDAAMSGKEALIYQAQQAKMTTDQIRQLVEAWKDLQKAEAIKELKDKISGFKVEKLVDISPEQFKQTASIVASYANKLKLSVKINHDATSVNDVFELLDEKGKVIEKIPELIAAMNQSQDNVFTKASSSSKADLKTMRDEFEKLRFFRRELTGDWATTLQDKYYKIREDAELAILANQENEDQIRKTLTKQLEYINELQKDYDKYAYSQELNDSKKAMSIATLTQKEEEAQKILADLSKKYKSLTNEEIYELAARKEAQQEYLDKVKDVRTGSSSLASQIADELENISNGQRSENFAKNWLKAFKKIADGVLFLKPIENYLQGAIENFMKKLTNNSSSGSWENFASGALSAFLGGSSGSGSGYGLSSSGSNFNADGSANYSFSSGSSYGSLSLGKGRASGGTLYPSTVHEILENGPEVLSVGNRSYAMSKQAGSVVPLTETQQSASVSPSISIHVDATGAEKGVEQRLQMVGDRIAQQAHAMVIETLTRQGRLSNKVRYG